MTRSRLLALALAALVSALSLSGCAKPGPEPSQPANASPSQAGQSGQTGQTNTNQPAQPVDAPKASPEEVDIAVRRALQGYLDALNRGSYEEAAAYWSPAAKVSADMLKTPGVTDWHFISSEMIDATATSASVQLSFSVKVAPNTATNYSDGRNTRFVRLNLEQSGWKILNMTTSP